MNTLASELMPLLLILIGAVFVHACFQLSVSVLTRLSAHTIGRGKSPKKLLLLSLCYTLGVIVATSSVFLSVDATFALLTSYDTHWPMLVVVSLLPVISLLIIAVYYRRDKGTQLWLPRPFINYLMDRAKKTHSGVEASMLGIATVVGELPFIVAPISIVLLCTPSDAASTFTLSLLYAAAVSLPLFFLTVYISSGHKISSIQNWRERNKTFLQWTSGIALLLLDVYFVSAFVWGVS